MQTLETKAKVALLWLLQTVNYAAYILIGFVEAGGVVTTGSADGLLIAIFFFVPCLMAWVSVVAPAASRWPNLVIGGLFVLLKLAATLGLVAPLTPAVFFNELWGLIAAGMLVWYAWKLPAKGGPAE